MVVACVFSVDDSYIEPFQVFFHSLQSTFSIPPDSPIFFLYANNLSHGNIDNLKFFLASYDVCATFLDASALIPHNLPIRPGDHVSISTFIRLFIADILPSSVDYAVYLDSDIIARRSIRDLFDISSVKSDSLLSAVDHCVPSEAFRVWGSIGGGYFQAGVLLIPLQRWRNLQMSHHFIAVMADDRDRILWWDQDILNIAIGDRWQRLSVWFNVCHAITRIFPVEVIEQNASLIHFSGASKPWNSLDSSPLDHLWYDAYQDLYQKPFDRSSLLPPRFPRLARLVSRFSSGIRRFL